MLNGSSVNESLKHFPNTHAHNDIARDLKAALFLRCMQLVRLVLTPKTSYHVFSSLINNSIGGRETRFYLKVARLGRILYSVILVGDIRRLHEVFVRKKRKSDEIVILPPNDMGDLSLCLMK